MVGHPFISKFVPISPSLLESINGLIESADKMLSIWSKLLKSLKLDHVELCLYIYMQIISNYICLDDFPAMNCCCGNESSQVLFDMSALYSLIMVLVHSSICFSSLYDFSMIYLRSLSNLCVHHQ